MMMHDLLRRRHPIVRRDAFGRTPHRNWPRRLLNHRYAPFVILVLPMVLAEVLTPYIDVYISLGPVIFVSGWLNGLLGALAGGPMIADEFRRQTWDTLAITPLGTGEIIYAKFAASLWQLRYWLGVQLVLRGIYLIVALAAVVTNRDPFGTYYWYNSSLWSPEKHAAILPSAPLFWVIFTAFALAQPVLAAAAGASLGILCSTLTQRPSLSRGLAFAARIATWFAAWTFTLFIFFERYNDVITRAYNSWEFWGPRPWEQISALMLIGGHALEFTSTVGEFAPGDGWPLVAGLAVIVLLAIIPTWAALRLAVAVLRRRRA